MNREIKFRGKSIHDGQWLYGLLNKGINGDEGKWYITEHGLYNNVEVDPATIGQWTGQKDENDKEIYENTEHELQYKGKNWRVRYNEDWTGYELYRQAYGDNENDTIRLTCDVACESIKIE